ncbi:ubiquinol-cytochrome c reductase iron-sulfur subunit [Fredinandcohnia quinoae]|uniref:Rieske 2Fe-2S domain-containing protein n=1 Tax=Fredinandcohnia quinoae TaxID=2918902 RepID=A0AAW5E9J7_9BACI|nr:Rieske 2Fe-2S domain-containing protein [Fredinandcohnia sp. SECRCQ15]MCH1626335.1 Rieske 2Fe-2S domain-containing protein [Fredinandcohnia sp. SECRCQ15]
MSDQNKTGRNQKDTTDDMINLVDNLNRDNDLKYNRRSFLKSAVGASVALGVATLPISIKAMMNDGEEDDLRYEIAKLSDIKKGESLNFNYPTEEEPAILVHTKDGELKAYNNKCTHLQCPVFYEKEEDVLLCPCHKGFFDVNSGHPIAGPPQRELPLIELEVKGGIVYAIGRKIRHG